MKYIRNLIKGWLLIFKVKNGISPSTQISQRSLYHYYRDCKNKNVLPQIAETGFRVFSQFEEDGKLLFIFSIIGMGNKKFVEIGSNDGINSNCANLIFNFGWTGLFIDGDKTSIGRGKKIYANYPDQWQYQPSFICEYATKDNVNALIQGAKIEGEIGLLSIDIDGDDYWIWEAITIIQPQVVIIETLIELGLKDVVTPYGSELKDKRNTKYKGASPIAMVALARAKGYRLIGANELGFNFIFLRNGIAENIITEVSVQSVLTHPTAQNALLDI